MNGLLLVCGFTTGSPCKYTSQGWGSWSDVHTDFEDDQYKMVYSYKVGSVMSGRNLIDCFYSTEASL